MDKGAKELFSISLCLVGIFYKDVGTYCIEHYHIFLRHTATTI